MNEAWSNEAKTGVEEPMPAFRPLEGNCSASNGGASELHSDRFR